MLGQTKQKSENPPSYYTSHQRALFTVDPPSPPFPFLFLFLSIGFPEKQTHTFLHMELLSSAYGPSVSRPKCPDYVK